MEAWARIESILDEYVRFQAGVQRRPLPIDLHIIANLLKNVIIEEREMIHEAGISISGERFRIYLQSNFRSLPGIRIRQRFSLAHELAHTLFFNLLGDTLKPAKDAPRGLKLELACQEGARRLLVPSRFLSKELPRERSLLTAEDIVRLARKVFDVSPEVIIRRLGNELDSAETCFALLRDGSLQYSMYPPWIKSILVKPLKSRSLDDWFRASGAKISPLANGSVIGGEPESGLTIRRLVVNGSSELIEIRRSPQHEEANSEGDSGNW